MVTQPLRAVFDAARLLSSDEQAELVDLLLTSNAPDVNWDAAWAEEAEARLAEYTRGDVQGEGADDAIAAGRSRLVAMHK